MITLTLPQSLTTETLNGLRDAVSSSKEKVNKLTSNHYKNPLTDAAQADKQHAAAITLSPVDALLIAPDTTTTGNNTQAVIEATANKLTDPNDPALTEAGQAVFLVFSATTREGLTEQITAFNSVLPIPALTALLHKMQRANTLETTQRFIKQPPIPVFFQHETVLTGLEQMAFNARSRLAQSIAIANQADPLKTKLSRLADKKNTWLDAIEASNQPQTLAGEVYCFDRQPISTLSAQISAIETADLPHATGLLLVGELQLLQDILS